MPDDRLTYVNVGPAGTFRASGALATTPADIDAIFSHIQTQGISKIAIHFHGGLVRETEGMRIAENMRTVFSPGSHPVTFIWETGLLETIKTNLQSIHQSDLFQKIPHWVIKKSEKHLERDDGGGAGAELSDSAIDAELTKDRPFESLRIGERARGAAGRLEGAILKLKESRIQAELVLEMQGDRKFRTLLETLQDGISSHAAEKLAPPGPRGVRGLFGIATAPIITAKLAGRVLKRYARGRDHGFYPTVVEEILRELYLAELGEWIYGGIKTTAQAMWFSNQGVQGDDRHVGRYFLEGLARLQSQTGLTVDLIGHSAGSIAICHMLGAAAEPGIGLRVRNVLLMAPAARADLFHEEVASKPGRFNALRIFTLADKYECADHVVPGVYPSSLLYFVSGVLEGEADVPLVGMERYLRKAAVYSEEPLPAIRQYLTANGSGRIVISLSREFDPQAGDGFHSNCKTHSGFDEDPDTLKSLKSIVSLQ